MTAFRDDPPPPNQGNSLSPSSSPHSNIPLSTAILEPRYQRIMQEIPPGNEDYSKEMMQLCWHFQRQGEVPVRPSSDEVKDLFRSVPYPKTSTGKGSKGGMRHHECLWPQCAFKDTLQKCMDHLFSQHMKVKFYRCGVDNCTMLFARKFDCDKHKNRTHNVPRPRAATYHAGACATYTCFHQKSRFMNFRSAQTTGNVHPPPITLSPWP